MQESWQITYSRGLPTLAVWAMQPDFELHKWTLTQHTTAVNSLPTLSQARKDKERALTTAQTVTNGLFRRLGDLNIRAAGAIHGLIGDENEDMHKQLDMVFAIATGDSQKNEVSRAQLLAGVWHDFDVARQAETPSQAPLVMKQGTANVTAAQFAQLLQDAIAAQSTEATAARTLSSARTALRIADRQVNRHNKRWYAAWTKTYPVDTPEGDAARSDVPTEHGVPAPVALEIESLAVQPDKQVIVTYAEQGGDHATTLELLYQLPGEPDFGHGTKVVRRVQMAGPFAPGTLVRFCTHAANSTDDSVFSEVRQVGVPA